MTEAEREELRGLNGWTLVTHEMPYDLYRRWCDLQVMARDEMRANAPKPHQEGTSNG